MGKPVNRSADRSESPFAATENLERATREQLERLIAGGESKVVEFKSTGRKNLHTGQADAAMEWSVVRTVAGFMNGHGGTLVVGVDDGGQPVGLEEDYRS
jgi:predicted HTH transcriptional regulator